VRSYIPRAILINPAAASGADPPWRQEGWRADAARREVNVDLTSYLEGARPLWQEGSVQAFHAIWFPMQASFAITLVTLRIASRTPTDDLAARSRDSQLRPASYNDAYVSTRSSGLSDLQHGEVQSVRNADAGRDTLLVEQRGVLCPGCLDAI
jgi:hypothetical protein